MSQIKVTITDGRTTQETITSSNVVNAKTGKVQSPEVKQNDNSSKALAVASMIGSQSFNYVTSNMGKWTGATQTQNKINNALQIASLGAMAYVNPYVAIATIGISIGTTAMDTAYEQKWDKLQSEYDRRRVGELKGRGR